MFDSLISKLELSLKIQTNEIIQEILRYLFLKILRYILQYIYEAMGDLRVQFNNENHSD